MALHTKKQFAALVDITTGNLSNYIKRGKVFCENELIDTEHEVNTVFIESRFKDKTKNQVEPVKPEAKAVKQKEPKPAPTPEKKVPFTNPKPAKQLSVDDDETFEVDEDLDDEDYSGADLSSESLITLERIKKIADIRKKHKETERIELDLRRKRGEVIPTELIAPIWKQHNQYMITQFQNGVNDILRVISHEKSLNREETAKIRGLLLGIVNNSAETAQKMSLESVDNIIQTFADRRGVGEHG